MPASFTVTLAAVVAVLLVLRLAVPRLPVAGLARPIRATDAAIAGIGVLGLLLHCGAMFARSVVEILPGARGVVAIVNDLGPGSVALFVGPALLVLIGLRTQRPLVLAALALSLTAVGVTMYGGASLPSHLTTIFVTVVLLSLTGTFLLSVRTPARSFGGPGRKP